MLTVTATIRERPPDHKGGYELASRVVASTAPTYEQARQECLDQMPEGWQLLFVKVKRDEAEEQQGG